MAKINLWPFSRSQHEQFEQMLKPHLQQLYKLAYRYTQQRDDAEDLVQDVLLKLYPKLDEMKKIDKLSPWLARVLYRHFVDKYRSQQRSPVNYTDEEQTLYDTHTETDVQPSDPREILESSLSRQRLQQALDQLNDEQRILVLLHDVEGYTLNEIHQMQDTPIGTLKSRLSRARSLLRDNLYSMEPFSETSRVNG